MDLGNGWNLPLAVTRKIALLDYLADNRSASGFIPLPSWAQGSSSDAHQLAVLDLRSFKANGWVELDEDYGGGVDTLLLGPGWTFIENLRAKRQDRPRRYQAARDAVLHWLYNVHVTGGTQAIGLSRFIQTPYGLFYGEPFSDDEVTKATSWLMDRELISGIGIGVTGQIFRAKILPKGITVVEGNRSVNDQEPIAATSVITYLAGDHNTVQAASPGASLTVTTTISDDHRRQALDFAAAIEQAQSVPSPEAAVAARDLREAVGSGQNDPSVVRQALEKAKVALLTGSTDILGKAVLGGFAGLLGHYGIPT